MLRARRRREKDSGGPLSRLVGLRRAYKHVRVLVTDSGVRLVRYLNSVLIRFDSSYIGLGHSRIFSVSFSVHYSHKQSASGYVQQQRKPSKALSKLLPDRRRWRFTTRGVVLRWIVNPPFLFLTLLLRLSGFSRACRKNDASHSISYCKL